MSFIHLSDSKSEWETVAERQQKIDEYSNSIIKLPLEEFRKIPYRPPRIAADSPQPGRDLTISESCVLARDGYKIGIRIYSPLKATEDHTIFFNIHGGGWTLGSPLTEEGQNRVLAVKNRLIVVSVDYRLAPEFPFPQALNDCLDVYRWVHINAKTFGGDPARIIVGGGSAGANLATVLAQIIRDEQMPGLIGQILNIPVTCHPDHFPHDLYEGRSFEQNASAPVVSASMMRFFWKNYLPEADSHEWTSPLLSKSLAGLPPTLIQVAGMDPLRDEGIAYAKALRENGVDTMLKIYRDMPHAFYIYPELKSSVEYLETMVDWIDQLTHNSAHIA